MPVTRNRNPDRAITKEKDKEELPDPVDGEDSSEGGDEPGEETDYFPAAEDIDDEIVITEAQDNTPTLTSRVRKVQTRKTRKTQTTDARIDSLMTAVEAVMGRLGSIETRISTQADQGVGRRLMREGEANDRDSDYDSDDGGYDIPGVSVPGFKRGRQLTTVEQDFYQEMKSLGLNHQSVDELFRHGYSSNESFVDFTDETVKTMVVAIGKHKHPQCPNAKLVFLSSSFMTKLCILVSWIRFQKQIGGDSRPVVWLEDSQLPIPRIMEDTKDRLRFNKQAALSRKSTQDTTLPPKLGNMKKFREFDEHFRNYLRSKFGAAGVPLSYTIRKVDKVTDLDRSRRVGEFYEDWNHYCIQCTLLKGPHWGSDNNALWQILSNLVREGPGWDYIRQFETAGGGNGRGAYQALSKQAYQHTNSMAIIGASFVALAKMEYNGPSRSMTWDQYVGQWFKHINILERMGEPFSPYYYMHMFLFSVKDPRLESAINNIQHPDTYKKETFESAQMYLTNALQIKSNNDTGNKNRRRNVSSTNQGGNSGNSGKSGKSGRSNSNSSGKGRNNNNYIPRVPRDEWLKLSDEEKAAHKAKIAKAKASKRNREVQAAAKSKVDEETESNTEKNAGSQFGSNAYANKRQKPS